MQQLQRRRFKQTTSLKERLTSEAKLCREEAELLAPGPRRDELLRRARQADAATHLEEWLRSPGLQPPK